MGGGAVFFFEEPNRAILSDINNELVNTYIAVRDNVDLVYKNLRIHSQKHSEEYYYQIREKRPRKLYTIAARMIYLNKACFNGIYRVNREGKFNVPFGMRDSVSFDKGDLKGSSEALQGVELLCQDFEATIDMARENDFLFCDPPYAVVNEDNRFVSYNADVFHGGTKRDLLMR